MPRTILFVAVLAVTRALPAVAQVHEVGDGSFAIPEGWTCQPGTGFGAMVLKADTRF
jgi:hypothetical protein